MTFILDAGNLAQAAAEQQSIYVQLVVGIRMALGSSRQAALGLVLRQAAAMCAAGLAIGLAAVWPASRSIQSFLFGVPALDSLTLLVVAVLLTLICLLAAAMPARRAAAIDPMQTLRTE